MSRSLAANDVNRAYIDEATKRAMLGPNMASSFGLPLSAVKTFKPSDLDAGPVVVVPAMGDRMIVPLLALCYVGGNLDQDLAGNLGWLAPEGADDEHNEPWLAVVSTPLFYSGDDAGSLVILPNADAAASSHLWPSCLIGRPFAVKSAVPPSRASRAGEVPPDEVELAIVVFYTVA
jgi:hypothetical protein